MSQRSAETVLTFVGTALCLLAGFALLSGVILLLLAIGGFAAVGLLVAVAFALIVTGVLCGIGAVAVRRAMKKMGKGQSRPPQGFEVLPPV
jgi:membrane protein implicated in regulation of membrane protease activity